MLEEKGMRYYNINKLVKGSFVLLTIFFSLYFAKLNLTSTTCTDFIINNQNISEKKWSTPIVISNTSEFRSLRPDIALDPSNNVHIVWQDMSDINENGNDEDIFYKYWNASTETWSEISVISPPGLMESVAPKIKADRFGNLHVIWKDKTDILGAGSDSDIFYRCWNKTSSTWLPIELVSISSIGNVYWFNLDVKEGIVYVVWQDASDYLGNGIDEDILFSKRSTDGVWTTAETVSTVSSGTSNFPDIKVDDDLNVHVCWDDPTDYSGAGVDPDVFYRIRNATTESWSTTEVISTSSDLFSQKAKIILLPNGNRFIIWVDGSNLLSAGNDHDIFYREWNNNTKSWSEISLLTDLSSGDSDVPSLYSDSKGNVHVFWFDTTDFDNAGFDQDIFYRHRNATTNQWSDYTLISTNSDGDSWRPQAAIDSNNNHHVVWQDKTLNYDGSGNDIDILYSSTLPSGAPHLTLIDKPLDIVQVFANENNSLTWLVSDRNVSVPVYTISRDDIQVKNGSWFTDIPIIFNINNLEVGNYTIFFEAEDGWGEYVFDEVLVIVQLKNQWVKPVSQIFLGLVVAAIPVTITIAIVLSIRKRRERNEN